MQNISWKFILLFLTHSCFYQCANIGNPEGGPRDTAPPVIDTAESTPNLQRNFNPVESKQDINFQFNEWIKLEDAFKQVVISPPLVYPPKIELKGKGVIVKFDPREILKANTTYTINFGKAIKDITENNAVKDFRFVFSTGDIIDTAFIAGKLVDAVTGESKEDQLIMLYSSDDDTLVYKQRPVYFSRSDKDGNFIIQNIKDTTYKIFALEDANSNYLYDQDKEKIAFFDRRVKSGEDSTTLILKYFTSFIRPRILNYNTETGGLVKIQANFPHEDLVTVAGNSGVILHPMISQDTLMVYYTPDTARDWPLEINFQNKPVDTIIVTKIRRALSDSFRLIQPRQSITEVVPGSGIEMTFNLPVGLIDTSRLQFIDDTTLMPFPYRLVAGRKINQLDFSCDCVEQQTYTLTILPKAILNYKGEGIDTLELKIRGVNSLITGTLIIDIEALDSTLRYLMILNQDDRELFTSTIEGQTSFSKSYRYLTPGVFSIRIVEDRNRNGRWDSGDYTNKLLPENILIQKNISVRANWELREQITWIK